MQSERSYFYKRTPKGRFNALKVCARKRRIEVRLSFEQYSAITAVGLCFYCSRSLPECGHGLDRKDSSLPYIAANVVPCCQECNWIKGDKLTFDEMVWIMARRRIEGRL